MVRQTASALRSVPSRGCSWYGSGGKAKTLLVPFHWTAMQRRNQPNYGVQATASSLRSYLAAASGSA